MSLENDLTPGQRIATRAILVGGAILTILAIYSNYYDKPTKIYYQTSDTQLTWPCEPPRVINENPTVLR